jgi:hypothetical protein
MSDWLVPVSKHLRFVDRNNRRVDATASDGYARARDALLTDRIASAVSEVRGPLVEARPGDTFWLYTAEQDVGVIATGRVRAPAPARKASSKNPPKSPPKSVLTIALDKARSRVFAADPLPASTIRRWVPELVRQASVRLEVRPRALAVLEGWQEERGERDVELLSPLGVTPWRALAKGKGKAHPAADPMLAPLSRLLRSQDFALGMLTGQRVQPWLVARRMRDVVVVDVERKSTARGRDQALAALGPLREYRWRLEREGAADLRVRTSLWLAFMAKPHDDVAAFLEDEEVLVSWQHRSGVVELTDRSKQRWYQYLGVR